MQATPDRAQGALLATAFSPVTVRGLAAARIGGVAPRLQILADLVRRYPDATLGAAFDMAHQVLARSYRSEYVFKNDVVSRIVFGRHNPRTASALIEQPMGESVADMVVLNGTTTVYEVKTDLDQFTRLRTQLADYCTRAEHVYVVTSVQRMSAAAALVPENVGVLGLRRRGQLTTFRSAMSNRNQLDVVHLFRMLRTSEVQAILQKTHGYQPDTHQGRMWEEMERLFTALPTATAHQHVLQQLHRRSEPMMNLLTSPTLPRSLRALMYTHAPSRVGVERIRKRLNMPAALFGG